jgi:pimeloyl-ACP methyl ester carboxylesterase
MQKRKHLSVLVNLIITIVSIYLIYLIFLYLVQRKLIFPGQSIGPEDYQDHWVKEDQKFRINTPEGSIEAWYIKSKFNSSAAQNPVVILAHGNYELIDFCSVETEGFNKLGYDVFLVEYPGFGRSEGRSSREAISSVYTTAYDWLMKNKNFEWQQIAGFGRSLGGGVICDLAEKRPLAGIILQSTFTSVKSFAKRYGAPAFLTRDPFDNIQSLKNFANPVLVIHGRRDALIPFEHGKKLAENISRAEFIAYDCGHNDCPPDWEQYWDTIGKFLSRIFENNIPD